jgi:hypothetical protein
MREILGNARKRRLWHGCLTVVYSMLTRHPENGKGGTAMKGNAKKSILATVFTMAAILIPRRGCMNETVAGATGYLSGDCVFIAFILLIVLMIPDLDLLLPPAAAGRMAYAARFSRRPCLRK